MAHQHLNKTKNAIAKRLQRRIASSNRENAIARNYTHPIEELQGAITYAIRSPAPANRTLKMGMCDRLVSQLRKIELSRMSRVSIAK
ncbi:MAG: hypothetical protein KME30_27895 [Iphinoe sp. HA4291-MV1]|nr:hypothetical protein [Iphinoe sp. HA4291-MV1]